MNPRIKGHTENIIYGSKKKKILEQIQRIKNQNGFGFSTPT